MYCFNWQKGWGLPLSLIHISEELRKEARAIPIERAMNYLDARKPLFYDKEGIYSVQKAKLYLAAGKREEARNAIYEILEDGPNLSGDSPMKEPLLAVIDAYQQSTSDSPSPLLRSSVYGLVETCLLYTSALRRYRDLNMPSAPTGRRLAA